MSSVISWILLASACLQIVVGIDHDELFSWQEPLWKNDTRMILLMVTDVNDQVGCYSVSGNTPRGINGGKGLGKNDYCFHNPLEFYWRTPGKGIPPEPQHWSPSYVESTAFGFEIMSLGRDRYMLMTQGLHLLVRRLEERWVGIMQIDGAPVATYYWWASVKLRLGVPSGVNYINMHGFRVKDCAIDYSQPVMKKHTPGDPWELAFGDDPLKACRLNAGVSSPTEPCGKVVSEYLGKHVEDQPSYNHFLSAIPAKFSSIIEKYGIANLNDTACEQLPAKLDKNLSEKVEYCVQNLMQSITLQDHTLMYKFSSVSSESRIAKMMKDSETQVYATLVGPRLTYLACLANYGARASMREENQQLSESLEDVQDQLRTVMSQVGKTVASKDGDAINPMVLVGLVAFSIIFNFCMCCFCCFYARRAQSSERCIELASTTAPTTSSEASLHTRLSAPPVL